MTAATVDMIPATDTCGVLLIGKGGKFDSLFGTSELIYKLDALQAEFWGQQNHHMGWMAEVAALEQNKPSSCDAKGLRWAAEVVELQERSKKDVKGVGAVKREARRFTRFTRGTSGFMYLSQLKTIDAALDATREKRGNELRPN